MQEPYLNCPESCPLGWNSAANGVVGHCQKVDNLAKWLTPFRAPSTSAKIGQIPNLCLSMNLCSPHKLQKKSGNKLYILNTLLSLSKLEAKRKNVNNCATLAIAIGSNLNLELNFHIFKIFQNFWTTSATEMYNTIMKTENPHFQRIFHQNQEYLGITFTIVI